MWGGRVESSKHQQINVKHIWGWIIVTVNYDIYNGCVCLIDLHLTFHEVQQKYGECDAVGSGFGNEFGILPNYKLLPLAWFHNREYVKVLLNYRMTSYDNEMFSRSTSFP